MAGDLKVLHDRGLEVLHGRGLYIVSNFGFSGVQKKQVSANTSDKLVNSVRENQIRLFFGPSNILNGPFLIRLDDLSHLSNQ